MERVLKGDAKVYCTQQADLVGSCMVGNFTTVMATMTVHIFSVLSYQDQKRYMYRYLRKPKTTKVRTFITWLVQLNNSLPYFSLDSVGQIVTAREILYNAMPNLLKKKMTKQRYNYVDMSFQEMSGFIETRVESLETPAPPPAIRRRPRKKNRKFPSNKKLSPLRILTKISQTTRKLQARRNSVSIMKNAVILRTNACTTLKSLIKKAKSNTSKGYRKGGEKAYTKHEVNILIEKKLEKAFKGRKKRKQELHSFEKIEVLGSEESHQSLTTVMHLVKAIIAEA